MVEIYDGKDMTDRQLLQAVALDRAVYPQNYWLDNETVLGYLHACPEVYTYAADGNELIAYLNMSCIVNCSRRDYRKRHMVLLCERQLFGN